jgi:hypothetical protein
MYVLSMYLNYVLTYLSLFLTMNCTTFPYLHILKSAFIPWTFNYNNNVNKMKLAVMNIKNKKTRAGDVVQLVCA